MRAPARLLIASGVLALLGLTGCGGDTPRGVLVQVLSSPADGPIPGTLEVEAVGAAAGPRTRLEPVSGDEPGLMVAPGTKDGAYRIVSSAGWGMLWPSNSPPPLSADPERAPIQVWMGRPHTLYVGASDRRKWTVSTEWVVNRLVLDADGTERAGERMPVEVVPPRQGLVGLRLRPEAWHGRLQAVGRMTSGALCQRVVIDLREGHVGPKMNLIGPAPRRPLRVVLVAAASGAQIPAGTEVVAEVVGVPFETRATATTRGESGVADFAGIASLGQGVRVAGFELDEKAWEREGVLYLLHVAEPVQAKIFLDAGGPTASAFDAIQIRPASGPRFGLVGPQPTMSGALAISTAAGPQQLLVRAGDRFALFDVDAEAGGDNTPTLPELEPGCLVQGTLKPPGLRHRVLFQRVEDDVRVLGQGLDVRVGPGGRYEALVPAGTYDVVVQRPDGRTGAVRRMECRPGARIQRDLTFE